MLKRCAGCRKERECTEPEACECGGLFISPCDCTKYEGCAERCKVDCPWTVDSPVNLAYSPPIATGRLK